MLCGPFFAAPPWLPCEELSPPQEGGSHNQPPAGKVEQEMKLGRSFRGIDLLSLGVGVGVGCFLVSMAYVTMYESDVLSFSMMASVENFGRTKQLEFKSNSRCNGGGAGSDGCQKNKFNWTLRISPSIEESGVPSAREEFPPSTAAKSDSKEVSTSVNNAPAIVVDRLQNPVANNSKNPDVKAGETKEPLCDTSNVRCDLCDIHGDIRITGKDTSTVLLVAPSQPGRSESWQVKPYARKWDHGLNNVKVVNVRSTRDPLAAPQCAVAHAVPAVVFSAAGYVWNHFHDFSDILVPLFQTACEFDGEVQLVVSFLNQSWIGKYAPFFSRLSRYEIVDYDRDERVHCFRRAIVGLRADGDLMIDPARSPMRYSMSDFREFMRQTYSLDRDYALRLQAGQPKKKKPRMLIITRRGTRKFENLKQIVKLAKVGFDVVVSEGMTDLASFSRIVNSCDVMLGVHGAGLTNLVFLPTNAVLIQVVPFGRHEWVASTYFANPAKKMGLQYLEYTIELEESTLTEQYSPDDPVLTDPISIHKLGWDRTREIYLQKQNVRLNLTRFRPVLEQALELLRRNQKVTGKS